MEKYIALIRPSDLKTEFIIDLIGLFSGNKFMAKENWERLNRSGYLHFLHNHEMYLNGTMKERDIENHKKQIPRWDDIRTKEQELGVTPVQYALIDKIDHMMFYRGGLKPILDMLHSFRRGVKRLNSNPSEFVHKEMYEWTYKNGNEKLSHKGNLPLGHFRWDEGTRYVLPESDLKLIAEFIEPLVKHL